MLVILDLKLCAEMRHSAQRTTAHLLGEDCTIFGESLEKMRCHELCVL
jgi:hypothetical protein